MFLKVSGCVPRRFCIDYNQKYIAYSSYTAIYILDVFSYKVVNVIIISDHDVDVEMFAKYQITGISLGPVRSLSNQGEDLVGIVINHTQLSLYEISTGNQVYRNVVEEKDDILEVYWSKTYDILFISFSHHFLKYAEYACSLPSNGTEFKKWDSLYDTSCLCYHPRMPDKICFGVFNWTKVYLCNLDSKTHAQYSYTSDEYEQHTTAVAFDPNHDSQLYIGCSDSCVYLVNFKDDFQIMKWSCFENAPYEIIPNPIKIGYFTVNVKQKQELYECQSASNKVQNVIRISGHYVSNHVNLQLDSTDPKNWTGDMLISSKNGAVMVYNIMNKSVKWVSDPSHQDTIFDAKVVEQYLCSCSFLGEVKVFNAFTNKEVVLYKTQDMINSKNMDSVYHISISPRINGNLYICGVTYLGYLYIWSLEDTGSKPKMKYSFSDRKRALICSWNQLDWTKIALGSETMKAALVLHIGITYGGSKMKGFQVEGSALTEHDGRSVYGVYFGTLPENRNHLLTCASDGRIRVFTPPYNRAIADIQAHSNRAFNAKFSPYYYNIIVSVSDDKTVSVSDWQKHTREIMVGHNNKIRGLDFVYGFKNIVVTGDWNGMIIVWDFIAKQALYKYSCHSNDVYGIASNQQYPLCLWTSSRDSTIRIHMLTQLKINFFIGKVIKYVYDVDIKKSSDGVVYQGNDIIDLLDFYVCCPYFKGISNSVNFHKKNKSNPLCNIQHYKNNNHIQRSLLEERYNKEVDKMINPNKVSNLKKIADEFLNIGAVERFCDINFEVKNYEKALIFAPAVGLDYWKSIMKRYIDILGEKQLDEKYEYATIIGDYAETLQRSCDYKNTNLNIINSVTQGHFPNLEVKAEKGLKFKEYRFFYSKIIKDLVQKEMVAFNPYMAISYYLSYENIHASLGLCYTINDYMLGMLLAACYGHLEDLELFLELCIETNMPNLDDEFLKNLKNGLESIPSLRHIYFKQLIHSNENDSKLDLPKDKEKYQNLYQMLGDNNKNKSECLEILLESLTKQVKNYEFNYDQIRSAVQYFIIRFNKSYKISKNWINNDSDLTLFVLYALYFACIQNTEQRQYELVYLLSSKFIMIYQSCLVNLKSHKNFSTLVLTMNAVVVKWAYASYYYSDCAYEVIEKTLRTIEIDNALLNHVSGILEKSQTIKRTGNIVFKQNIIDNIRQEYASHSVGENLPNNDCSKLKKIEMRNQYNMIKFMGFYLDF